jgi:hypothetical protein
MYSAKDILMNTRRVPVIVTDTGPLIHLVGSDLLDDVLAVCEQLIIPDMVFIEATKQGKPFADRILLLASHALVSIHKTTTGEMYAAALKGEPTFNAKNAGERAIIDWLLDEIDQTSTPAIVLYENGKVPRLIENHDIDANVSVLTTRAFFEVLKEINATNKDWEKVMTLFPTMNAKITESHYYRSSQ